MNWETRIGGLFGDSELLRVASRETQAKSCDAQDLRRQLEQLRVAWPELRERLSKQLLSLAEVERRLKAVGAPIRPEQIGISRVNLRQSFWQAFFIRRRFTVLDLAVRAARLDHCLGKIFGPTGAWPI